MVVLSCLIQAVYNASFDRFISRASPLGLLPDLALDLSGTECWGWVARF